MSIVASDIYDSNVICVKKYGENTVKIIHMESCRKKGFEELIENPKKGSKNTEKLSNNITRAKTTIREYALCNKWDFWCTFTINPRKYNRYHLDDYIKDFTEFIHNYNRRKEEKCRYLFIPEQHKDGAWHIHGFISGIAETDIYINKFGYFAWKQYEEKFGFISMTKLDDDIERLASYCLKYISVISSISDKSTPLVSIVLILQNPSGCTQSHSLCSFACPLNNISAFFNPFEQ